MIQWLYLHPQYRAAVMSGQFLVLVYLLRVSLFIKQYLLITHFPIPSTPISVSLSVNLPHRIFCVSKVVVCVCVCIYMPGSFLLVQCFQASPIVAAFIWTISFFKLNQTNVSYSIYFRLQIIYLTP